MLIVDDNATNRHILEEWLRGWQMEPAAVGDGLAAMDALWDAVTRAGPIRWCCSTRACPTRTAWCWPPRSASGAELSATRIILLTSGDRPGDLARPRELRIDAHLLKPVQQDELLETIYQVMNRAKGDEPSGPAPDPQCRRPGRDTAANPGGRGQRIQRAAHGATARPAGATACGWRPTAGRR